MTNFNRFLIIHFFSFFIWTQESIFKEAKRKIEEKTATALVEQQRIQTRNDCIIADLNNKVIAAMKEVTRMQEAETKLMKERREEKVVSF